MEKVMESLVNLVDKTKFEDLPKEVIHETKRALLDCIGVGIGAPLLQHGRTCRDFGKKLGGRPESTILGGDGKVSCLNAAFTNGELISALLYECMFANRAPSFVIPAALAAAEFVSAPGKDLILSVALGLEVAGRITSAVKPAYWPIPSGPKRGQMVFEDVSGTGFSVFGAAAAAGKLFGLSYDKMATALGIAGYAAPPSTNGKWMDTYPAVMTGPGPAGFSAEAGVKSALLADMGYTGDTNVFEGKRSYWRFAGFTEWNIDPVVANIGKEWRCHQIYYKKYPGGM
jgi:2-methylcitrate dehydratase PrpD